MKLRVEPEPGDVVLRVLGADGLQDTDRDQVLRPRERRTNAHGAIVLAIIVLRLPGLRPGLARSEAEWGVVDHRPRREAALECSRVDERLEARPGLADCLGDVVELRAVEVETADQCPDRAIGRVYRDQRRLDLRQLGDVPVRFLVALQANHGARAQPLLERRLLADRALRKAQAFASHGDPAQPPAVDDGRLVVDPQHDCREKAFAVRIVLQQIFELFVGVVRRQIDETFRSAKAMTSIVSDNTTTDSGIRCKLVLADNRRVYPKPARVRFVPEPLVHHLTDHFGHVVGVHGRLGAFAARRHHMFLGPRELGSVDIAEFAHPPQYILLAQPGTLRVDHRIEARRRLRQPGEHRHLGNLKLVKRFAEIGLRSGGEAVGALAKEYLVDVELQNLVLGQARFDLEGKQRLVKLPRERLFPGQEEVPGNLHRDRARALASTAAGEVGHCRTDDAEVIYPAMLVEAVVLGREDGLLHQVGNGIDLHERPSLLAEFPDKLAVSTVDTQRHLRPVIGQHLEGGEVRESNRSREYHHEHGKTAPSGGNEGSNQRPAFEHGRL